MRKIVIAGSRKTYKEAQIIKEKLEQFGYEVIDYPKNIDHSKELEYKVAYEKFYEKLKQSDDFLLLNIDKNGIKGYIGYEAFAELSFMIANSIVDKKESKIFIYQIPSEKLDCYDEITLFLKLGYIKIFDEQLLNIKDY